MWADVYAAAALARRGDALEWLARQDGYETLIVGPDGATRVTPGMAGLLSPTSGSEAAALTR